MSGKRSVVALVARVFRGVSSLVRNACIYTRGRRRARSSRLRQLGWPRFFDLRPTLASAPPPISATPRGRRRRYASPPRRPLRPRRGRGPGARRALPRRPPATPCRASASLSRAVSAISGPKPSAPTRLAIRAVASAISGAAPANRRACDCSRSIAASRSSSARKPAGALASNGNRCSTRSQKAWMVWIFRPPGVSMTRANSFRASCRSARLAGGAPSAAMSAASAASSSLRPAGEAVEHALGHVRRRRLGEGQAEDLRRRGAGEQEPQHALRQHMRLARAGVGRHPGGALRIGRLALAPRRILQGGAHVSSPSDSAHSATRARWS